MDGDGNDSYEMQKNKNAFISLDFAECYETVAIENLKKQIKNIFQNQFHGVKMKKIFSSTKL